MKTFLIILVGVVIDNLYLYYARSLWKKGIPGKVFLVISSTAIMFIALVVALNFQK